MEGRKYDRDSVFFHRAMRLRSGPFRELCSADKQVGRVARRLEKTFRDTPLIFLAFRPARYFSMSAYWKYQ
jgi:hypothetical protein